MLRRCRRSASKPRDGTVGVGRLKFGHSVDASTRQLFDKPELIASGRCANLGEKEAELDALLLRHHQGRLPGLNGDVLVAEHWEQFTHRSSVPQPDGIMRS